MKSQVQIYHYTEVLSEILIMKHQYGKNDVHSINIKANTHYNYKSDTLVKLRTLRISI